MRAGWLSSETVSIPARIIVASRPSKGLILSAMDAAEQERRPKGDWVPQLDVVAKCGAEGTVRFILPWLKGDQLSVQLGEME